MWMEAIWHAAHVIVSGFIPMRDKEIPSLINEWSLRYVFLSLT